MKEIECYGPEANELTKAFAVAIVAEIKKHSNWNEDDVNTFVSNIQYEALRRYDDMKHNLGS